MANTSYTQAKDKLVHYFDNMDVSKIVRLISKYPEELRSLAYFEIASAGNTEGAEKFDKANRIVRVKNFLKINDNNYEDYLSDLSLSDKYKLLADMGFFNPDLSNKEKNYFSIIENSINENIKRLELSSEELNKARQRLQ